MNLLRFLLCITTATLLTSQATGCKKRKPSEVAGEGASSAVNTTPEASPPLQGTTRLPEQQEAALAASHKANVKPWSQLNAGEKQDAYSYWLHQHQFGDASRRAQVIAELQKAGLSPTERKTMEDMRLRYGFGPLNF